MRITVSPSLAEELEQDLRRPLVRCEANADAAAELLSCVTPPPPAGLRGGRGRRRRAAAGLRILLLARLPTGSLPFRLFRLPQPGLVPPPYGWLFAAVAN